MGFYAALLGCAAAAALDSPVAIGSLPVLAAVLLQPVARPVRAATHANLVFVLCIPLGALLSVEVKT